MGKGEGRGPGPADEPHAGGFLDREHARPEGRLTPPCVAAGARPRLPAGGRAPRAATVRTESPHTRTANQASVFFASVQSAPPFGARSFG